MDDDAGSDDRWTADGGRNLDDLPPVETGDERMTWTIANVRLMFPGFFAADLSKVVIPPLVWEGVGGRRKDGATF
jgi:hypothetical protein